MKNSVVIGHGTVGKATMMSFGIEKFYSRSESNITLEEVANCKYIFICLPTPTVDGKCFTEDIYEFIKSVLAFPNISDRIFIIRSTVNPGFSIDIYKSLGIDNIVSNPEFLSEDTWEKDAKQPTFAVIGSTDPKYARIVEGIYKARFKYLEPVITDSTTAEMIKVVLNNFFSLKVMFGNEMFDFAKTIGANYETVRKALERHEWGSNNHFNPIYKEKRGIHGKCLPKDLEAFSIQSESVLLTTVNHWNKQYEQ